jgi:hypothetical protein
MRRGDVEAEKCRDETAIYAETATNVDYDE